MHSCRAGGNRDGTQDRSVRDRSQTKCSGGDSGPRPGGRTSKPVNCGRPRAALSPARRQVAPSIPFAKVESCPRLPGSDQGAEARVPSDRRTGCGRSQLRTAVTQTRQIKNPAKRTAGRWLLLRPTQKTSWEAVSLRLRIHKGGKTPVEECLKPRLEVDPECSSPDSTERETHIKKSSATAARPEGSRRASRRRPARPAPAGTAFGLAPGRSVGRDPVGIRLAP